MTTPETTEPDPVDQLAEDVAAETLEYPEGTPELRPVLALPRMRRADAYEALGHIQDEQRRVKRAEPDVNNGQEPPEDVNEVGEDGNDEVKPVELDPLSYGAQYRVVAYIEQYLGVVAKSPKAYAAWVAGPNGDDGVSDADLVKTFNVYMRKAQPGEAASSTS
jgi:hypothetical protein